MGSLRKRILELENNIERWTTPRYSPSEVQLPTSRRAILLALGYAHTVCLLDNKTVWTWGSNKYGQLGRNVMCVLSDPTPQRVEVLSNVRLVAAGYVHSGVVTDDGRVLTWGCATHSRLGFESTDSIVCVPKPLKAFYACEYGESRGAIPIKVPRVIDLVLGDDDSAAITCKGELYTWGDATDGKLGHGNRTITQRFPLRVHAFRGRVVRYASLGGSHSAAISKDGRLYTWVRLSRLSHVQRRWDDFHSILGK